MSSEGQLHTAMLNSLPMLIEQGAGNELVQAIEGIYSQNVSSIPIQHKSKLITSFNVNTIKEAKIKWKSPNTPIRLSEIYDELKKDGAISPTLQRLVIIRKENDYSQYIENTFTNMKIYDYNLHSFKYGVLKRWKADYKPSNKVMEKLKEARKKAKELLGNDVSKRFKDTILVNDRMFTREELSERFPNCHWILILLESRTGINVMELTELE